MRFRLVVFIFLYSTSGLWAAANDSLQKFLRIPTSVKSISEVDFAQGLNLFLSPDSSLTGIEEVNPALPKHYNYSGVYGSALYPQLFEISGGVYSNPSVKTYDEYLFSSEKIRYFRSNKRYSEMQYHSGSFKEQQIRLKHSQNILKNWSAGFDFNRMAVKDYLKNSDPYQSQFALFTWYESENKRYNLFSHVYWNTLKTQVNGGLSDPVAYENSVMTNVAMKGLGINLADAEQHLRNHAFYLSQYYDFGKRSDTLPSSTVKTALRFHHEIRYESGSFAYSDKSADSSFYHHYYYGATTDDSLYYSELRNKAGLILPFLAESRSSFRRNFSASVMGEYQVLKFGQIRDTSWQNASITGTIATRPDPSRFHFQIDGQFVLAGAEQGNFNGIFTAQSPDYKYGQLTATLCANQHEPDLIYTRYESNHFYWNNSWDPEKSLLLGARYDLKKYKFYAEAKVWNIVGHVYFNSAALPVQSRTSLQVSRLSCGKNFAWRKLHFDNTIHVQSTSSQQEIPLPELASSHSIYLHNYFFKKALLAEIGLSMHYNRAYYAPAYMPATGNFYNQDLKNAGGYQFISLFIDMKIKTARIFIKMENLGDDLIKNTFSYIPDYPMPGRTLKFGFIWRFFDQ